MQLTDKDGNIFGTGGLEITTSSGKPKVPVINTDITIGTTAIVGGVAGRLLFEGAGNVVQESSSIFWDIAGNKLNLGSLGVQGELVINRASTGGSVGGVKAEASGAGVHIGGGGYYDSIVMTNGSGIRFNTYNGGVVSSERLRITGTTGNVLINTTTDSGFKLDVNGSSTFRGEIRLNANIATGGNRNYLLGNSGDFEVTTNTNIKFRNFYNASDVYFSMNYGSGGRALFSGLTSGTGYRLATSGNVIPETAVARGVYFNNTLVAAANNDVLVGLDVQPTFTNGAFTGVANYNLRTGGLITKQYFQSPTTNQGNHSISFGFGGAGEQVRLIASAAGAVGRGNLYIASASGDTAVATISDANALFAFAGNSFYKSFTIDQVSLTTGQGLYISGNQPASVINGIFFRYSETRVAILSKPHGSNGYADFRIAIVPVGGANNPPQESDTKFMITKDTTNVLVNTTIDSGFKLDVNGSARVQSGLTVSGSLNLNSSDISSAWTAYTPTWSTDGVTQPSLGNGRITGAYKVIGKTVFVRIKLNFGTTTTGGTGTFYFSLPVNAATPASVMFPCSILDNGFAWYQATANGEYGGFTDKVALIGQSPGGANSSQSVTAVFPIGFGNLDSIQFGGSYESI